MFTITFTRITAAGITAIGMPGTGTRVAGSNGAEPNFLLSKDPMKNRHFLPTLNRYFDGSIVHRSERDRLRGEFISKGDLASRYRKERDEKNT
jgi:hypothetical protein